ncbi:MAG: hypothetical protein ACOCX5_00225 [Chloroflexota bacterium]
MTRRYLFLSGLLLLALLGSITAVQAQAVVDLTVTITQNANVRSGPGADFDRVGVAARGTAMRLDGRIESGEWVRGITERGVVGWVVSGVTGLGISDIISLRIINQGTPFTLSAPAGAPQPAQSDAPAGPPDADIAPVNNTAPVRGFSYGGHMAGFEESAFNWMRYSGMTWIKKQWRYVDGQDPQAAADWINIAHANGFRILLGVVGQSPNDLNNPGYFDRYAGFVAGLARLGVDAIEIWNEPNIDHEWPAGQISPARYTELLRVSYNAIKNANPNTLVISGAPAPTGAEAAFPGRVMNDDNFLAGMAAAGAANYMDCVGVHYNEGIVPPTWTSGDPRGNSEYYTRYLRRMMDVYYNAFRGRKPLCFTELGYLTPEGLGPLPPNFLWAENTSLAEQAAWLDGAINIAARSGRVRLLIVWNINFTNYGADPMAGFAIVRPGNTCPACDALAN